MNRQQLNELRQRRQYLQQQLSAHRQQFVGQLSGQPNAEHNAEQSFPRSATMRFLTNKAGLALLASSMLRKLLFRHPLVTSIVAKNLPHLFHKS